jgi:hypothetical protein
MKVKLSGNVVNIEGKGNPIQGVGRLTIVRGGHSILFQSRHAARLIIGIGQECLLING